MADLKDCGRTIFFCFCGTPEAFCCNALAILCTLNLVWIDGDVANSQKSLFLKVELVPDTRQWRVKARRQHGCLANNLFTQVLPLHSLLEVPSVTMAADRIAIKANRCGADTLPGHPRLCLICISKPLQQRPLISYRCRRERCDNRDSFTGDGVTSVHCCYRVSREVGEGFRFNDKVLFLIFFFII